MKILFLFLSFSLHCFGQSLETKSISLPSDLAGVKLKNPGDKQIKLNVQFIRFNKFINIKTNRTQTIESFFQNLMHIYKTKNRDKLFAQFDKSSQNKLKNLKNFDTQFEVLSLIRKPFLKTAQVYNEGYIIRWTDESFLDERKIYIKMVGDEYKIFKLSISKDEDYFWNTNLYFKYLRFEKKKPKIITSFDEITDQDIKELMTSVDEGFTHLNIFKSSDEMVNLVALDNYESPNYPFKDHDKRQGRILLRFSGKNFKKKGKHKLYLLQSTYPLGRLTPNSFNEAISINIIKK